MARSSWLRSGFLAVLLIPAAAVLNDGPSSPAQVQMTRVWKCGKCGGHLGEGLNPPSHCHHCNSRIINAQSTPRTTSSRPQSGSKPSGGVPVGMVVFGGAVVLVILAAGIMKGRG